MGAGVFDAGAGPRHGLEPVGLDLFAADLADAVGPVVDLAQGGVEVADLRFELFQEREVLLPLEGLCTGVALVLVERRQLRDLLVLRLRADPLGLPLPDEALQAFLLAHDQLACVFGVHAGEGTPRRPMVTPAACPAALPSTTGTSCGRRRRAPPPSRCRRGRAGT